MCPVCIVNMLLLGGSAAAIGGFAAFVLKRIGVEKSSSIEQNKEK